MAKNGSFGRQDEDLESAFSAKQTIRESTDDGVEVEEIHKKIFRKWINFKLAMAEPPLEVTDLLDELRDGHVLFSLLEILLGTTLKRAEDRIHVNKLDNVATVLKLLEQSKVKLVGIRNYDIVEGKTKPILGLIWSIILRFQVQGVMTEYDSDSSVMDFEVEKKLLSWCQTSLEGYEDVVRLKDFTSSWRDGLAFNAIIHSHRINDNKWLLLFKVIQLYDLEQEIIKVIRESRFGCPRIARVMTVTSSEELGTMSKNNLRPELFEFESLLGNDNQTNLDHAFNVAYNEVLVPKLLEPEDIDVDKPDKKLIIMYLTSLYHGLREYSPQGGTNRRKLESTGVNSRLNQEAEKDAKLATFQEKRYSLVLILRNCLEKLENLRSKGAANDMREVNEQQNIVKECDPELRAGEPLLQEVILYGRELTQDNLLDDNEKEKITRDTAQLLEHYDHLRNFIDDEQESLDKLYKEMVKQSKIRDWETKRNDLNNKLEVCEEKLRNPEQEKKPESFKAFAEEVSALEPGVTSVMDSGNKLLQSETLTINQIDQLFKDVHDIEDRYEALKNRINDALREEETERTIKLDTWRNIKEKSSTAIADSRSKLHEIKSKDSRTTPEIQEQLEEIKKCRDVFVAAFPGIQSCSDYGTNLLADNQFNEEEKNKIKQEIESLGQKFQIVQKDINGEQDRLEGLLKTMDHKTEIMEDWREKCSFLKSELDAADEIIQQGKNAKSPEKIENCYFKLKELTASFEYTEPDFNKILDYGRGLASKEDFSSDSRKELGGDVALLEERGKTILKVSRDEYARIEVALEASQAKQRDLWTWHERCDTLSRWVNDRYVRLGSRPPSPKATLGGIKRQESVIEDLIEEMETKVEEVNNVIDEGNQIIDDDSMPEKERTVVHETMIGLHDDWNKLAILTSGRQLIVQVLLKKEQNHEAQELRRKIDSLMIWISSAEHKLNTQFPIAPDLDTVTKQKYDLEDFVKEMLCQQSELSDTLETEDKLVKDSDLLEDDRNARQKGVLDLSYRWRNLEELVSSVTGRIDEMFQKLRIQEQGELRELREGLDEVNGWVIVQINSSTTLASDVDAAFSNK